MVTVGSRSHPLSVFSEVSFELRITGRDALFRKLLLRRKMAFWQPEVSNISSNTISLHIGNKIILDSIRTVSEVCNYNNEFTKVCNYNNEFTKVCNRMTR